MPKEKKLVVDLRLSKKLVLLHVAVLIMVALLVSFSARQDSASAEETAETQSEGMRQFYLSVGWFSAIGAPDGCVPGYHFASLWEIADPSNLKYNTYYGRDKDDSGGGPPSGYYARVRTGYSSNNSSTPGYANCNAWTSTTGHGTRAALLPSWSSSPDIGVWNVTLDNCSATATIWCIED